MCKHYVGSQFLSSDKVTRSIILKNIAMFLGLFNKHLSIIRTISIRKMSISFRYASQAKPQYSYKTLSVENVKDNVFHVQMNRPEKMNAMSNDLVREIQECFSSLSNDSDCRAIVLSGKGKTFTSGIDLQDFTSMGNIVTSEEDIARKCKDLKEFIQNFQRSMSSLENCSKPVICAVHNACIGGGIDLISSADIRYCSSDAWFQIKEVDLGLAADVGTLQRFPKIIGSESLARELCLTARKFFADEALRSGFVTRIFPDHSSLIKGALDLASNIAEKSPVAIQATKDAMIYSRDHSVQEGLDYIATMNMSLLQSEDVRKAVMAMINKEKASFAKL